jgi:dihydroflavonol-4-reductase
MRVLVTGAAGFIGGAVVRQLRARGDDVVALVRDGARARAAADLGATILADDLSDAVRLTRALRDRSVDALVHAAGSYRIGIPATERAAMWDANVGTTTRVLDAAEAAGIARIVYLSTVNTFGNTRGVMVDETYRRDPADGYLSWYDETKVRAHAIVEERIGRGAPIKVAIVGTVIGPGDHSGIGAQLRLAHAGRLRYVASAGTGIAPVHVDDEAAGIVAVLDHGSLGRSWILAGECVRLGEALEIAAAAGGHRLPGLRIPDGVLRAMAPLGRLTGLANARETISASVGVTYWATSDRARAELGWTRRDAAAAIRDTVGAARSGRAD